MSYYPGQQPAPRADLRPALPPGGGYGRVLWVLVFLILVLAMPYLAENLEYALTRGRQRAEHDAAAKELAGLPETTSVYRLVAKSIAPSVVGVVTLQRGRRAVADPMDLFFGGGGRQLQSEALGSGVIVDKQGYIITNAHVIDNATQIQVQLSDGRAIDNVQVVGDDPANDIAVLKINAGDLVAAPWGDSDKLEAGDPVLAVGNPYGLSRTVTAGIISAKERRGQTANSAYQDFLQTDAAVNPGNSGGPLVNMRGQVVGINTAIYGETYQGISFAIPSNIAKNVYDRLRGASGKRIVRGWLGVQPQEIDQRLARLLGLKDTQGVLVAGVVPDGPAETAGIQIKDVIVELNGRPVRDPNDLILQIARLTVGSQAKLVVIRDGQRMEITVTIGEHRPAFDEAPAIAT